MDFFDVLSIGSSVLDDKDVRTSLRILGNLYYISNYSKEDNIDYRRLVSKDIIPLYLFLLDRNKDLDSVDIDVVSRSIVMYTILRAKFIDTIWSIYIEEGPLCLVTDGNLYATIHIQDLPNIRRTNRVSDLHSLLYLSLRSDYTYPVYSYDTLLKIVKNSTIDPKDLVDKLLTKGVDITTTLLDLLPMSNEWEEERLISVSMSFFNYRSYSTYGDILDGK